MQREEYSFNEYLGTEIYDWGTLEECGFLVSDLRDNEMETKEGVKGEA